jgi:hypothetical protein
MPVSVQVNGREVTSQPARFLAAAAAFLIGAVVLGLVSLLLGTPAWLLVLWLTR